MKLMRNLVLRQPFWGIIDNDDMQGDIDRLNESKIPPTF